MSGTESAASNPGGFDLLRRATQAMMSRFVLAFILHVQLQFCALPFRSLSKSLAHFLHLRWGLVAAPSWGPTPDIEYPGLIPGQLASPSPGPGVLELDGGNDDGPFSTRAQQLQQRLLESASCSG
ncbi:Serine/threonine-protein kinase SCH9 [Fusarium sp. Ph1]|nr:Serine/threonine-protein kinase SCH9 [Fusarium sp. Ph1]